VLAGISLPSRVRHWKFIEVQTFVDEVGTNGLTIRAVINLSPDRLECAGFLLGGCVTDLRDAYRASSTPGEALCPRLGALPFVGIRMALGADRRRVLNLILGRVARRVGLGILVGTLVSLGMSGVAGRCSSRLMRAIRGRSPEPE
jgi:hypothetical protein